MHRRQFLCNTGLLAAGSLVFQKQSLACLPGPSEYKVRMLRDNVGIFTERGGSVGFFLGKQGIVVIDSQFPETAPHLVEDLKKRSEAPIQYLLNTHHHRDHTSGNIRFKGIVDHVVAHQNCLDNLKKVSEKDSSLDKQLLPDLPFTENYKLKFGDETITGSYYGAAHTNGDAVYHFEKANVMHVGDLMFNKRHPRVDRGAGASIRNWIKVHDKIVSEAAKDTIIIFGHSLNAGEETGSVEDIKKFQDYLGKVLAFAESEIKKGVSKENFIANSSIPGVKDWTGQGIRYVLTAAYEEVSEKN